MSGNTESTANSFKFAPMPMSALLASLVPLQKESDSRDSSFTSADESDNSFGETVAKKPSPLKVNNDYNELRTPNTHASQYKVNKGYASEKKITHSNHDKENVNDDLSSNRTYPNNKDSIFHSTHKSISGLKPPSDIKNRAVLMQHNNQVNQNKINSVHKKTPEICRVPSSSQKVKSATPKIKSGIRKFTPGSKQSHKKTPQKVVIQNRDKVRCELFSKNPTKEEAQCPPPRPEPAPAPVPETPLNKKVLPTAYAATPSYPQGPGYNPKIQVKTTSIKDKKYMFIKKLGTGGSSVVYKVSDC